MDGKVNLPSPTADIGGQGLEDVFSIKESIYEDRHDYTLSLADWTNYLEDVDRVFALLNSHHEQNRTSETTAAQSDGFLAVSAESEEDPGPVAEAASPLTFKPCIGTDQHSVRRVDLNNDIPEVSHSDSEHWKNHKTDRWMEREEMSPLELDLSGGDRPELVLKPDPRLQVFPGRVVQEEVFLKIRCTFLCVLTQIPLLRRSRCPP